MGENVHNSLRAVFVILLLVAVPSVGMSQSTWLPPSEENSVSLEVFKVDWADDEPVSFVSSAWFLTGQYLASHLITINNSGGDGDAVPLVELRTFRSLETPETIRTTSVESAPGC